MKSRDAGAQADTAAPTRLTVRDVFLGRRFRVHRLVLLTVVVALILVVAYVIKVSGSAELEGLPGVTRVDREQHQVALSPTITAAEAREVFHRAQQLSEPWILTLGPARLATANEPGAAGTDGRDAVDLLRRLGTAEPVAAAVITIDTDGPTVDAEPGRPDRVIPLARTMITELTAKGAAAVDRLAVHRDQTVTVTAAALSRPTETDAVLALLERVPGLSEAVLGEGTKARVHVNDEAAAAAACRAGRNALGERTDIELTVQISTDADADPDAEPIVQPC